MKILLVGEFSGVHMTLAQTLKENGHDVISVSDGDSYKNFSRDITIKSTKRKGIIAALCRMFLDMSGMKGLFTYWKYRKIINTLTGFDVVQMINTVPLDCFGSVASFLLVRRLKTHNKKFFLCALGDDYRWVKACLERKYKYSALSNLTLKTSYKYVYSLKYVYGLFYKQLHMYIEKKCDAIIPGLIDYEIAYEGVHKLTPIVPLPLPTRIINEIYNDEILSADNERKKVNIFHGWQVGKELKKGNYLFDEAVKRIQKSKWADKIEYEVIKSIPFNDYIAKVKNADIFLDQTYSYDRGMNAIFGMAYSSVVFSGFQQECDSKIGVAALPDIDYIERKLLELIEDPDLIKKIKDNSRSYALEKHDPEKVMRQYLYLWEHQGLVCSQLKNESINGNN